MITTADVSTGQTLSSRVVKARKDHQCDCCKKRIAKGVRYYRAAFIDWDGEFQTIKTHLGCG